MSPQRVVTALISLATVAAVAAALCGLVPYELLQPLGRWIRRPDDVTPERYSRYLQICWLFAVLLATAAVWMKRHRARFETFLKSVVDGGGIRPEAGPPREWVVLGVIAVVGTVLRLILLDQPVAYDEAYTYINFASRPWYIAIADYNSTNNHLLNTFLVHWCARLAGPEEWAIRLPVFVSGALLPVAVFVWGRGWMGSGAALVAAALVAVAPELITYSVDARGYMYVAVLAIVLDLSLARLRAGGSARWWCVASAAIFAGFCAMPIMLYALLASGGWFVLAPAAGETPEKFGGMGRRVLALVPPMFAASLGILAFYAPAYIFRGLAFLHDPIMQSTTAGDFLRALAGSWSGAARWWTDGFWPGWAWGIAVALGLVGLGGDAAVRVRFASAFGAVLLLNVVQWVAPPPRIFLHLAPWVFLLAGSGVVRGLVRIISSEFAASSIASAVILVAGIGTFASREILFHPEDRAGYPSVPAAIARIHGEVGSGVHDDEILMAPLPCDLPSIFYMDRLGFRVRLNEPPDDGERVWLIARRGESPEQVLNSNLIRLGRLVPLLEPWETVEEFETLTLYRSSFDEHRDASSEEE